MAPRLRQGNRAIESRLQVIGFASQLSVGPRPAQLFRQNFQIFSTAAAQQSGEFIGIEGKLRKGRRFAFTPARPGPLEETLEHLHVFEPRLRACAIKSRTAPLVPLAAPSNPAQHIIEHGMEFGLEPDQTVERPPPAGATMPLATRRPAARNNRRSRRDSGTGSRVRSDWIYPI